VCIENYCSYLFKSTGEKSKGDIETNPWTFEKNTATFPHTAPPKTRSPGPINSIVSGSSLNAPAIKKTGHQFSLLQSLTIAKTALDI